MKLPESVALELLFVKHGLFCPKFLVLKKGDPIPRLDWGEEIVVKANIPAGGKKKAGLVVIGESGDLESLVKEILAKSAAALPFDSVLVEEFIPHDKEHYLALKAVREGVEILSSGRGGIEVEANWTEVKRSLLDEELIVHEEWDVAEHTILAVHAGGNKEIAAFMAKMLEIFVQEDAIYLEINPYSVVHRSTFKVHGRKSAMSNEPVPAMNRVVMPLGIALEVDDAAEYHHPEWEELGIKNNELGKTEREKKVAEVDSQIKGSVKLVEVKDTNYESGIKNYGKKTALMAAGAGAALFLSDAIIDHGLALANYAEFSGNPPSWAVTELTKQVCAIPGIKDLVIGSGIANFTPVVPNFEAIIKGLKESPNAKKLNIVVRRCGPGEEVGIKMMRDFAQKEGYKIQVFGRETGMTEIVNKLKQNS